MEKQYTILELNDTMLSMSVDANIYTLVLDKRKGKYNYTKTSKLELIDVIIKDLVTTGEFNITTNEFKVELTLPKGKIVNSNDLHLSVESISTVDVAVHFKVLSSLFKDALDKYIDGSTADVIIEDGRSICSIEIDKFDERELLIPNRHFNAETVDLINIYGDTLLSINKGQVVIEYNGVKALLYMTTRYDYLSEDAKRRVLKQNSRMGHDLDADDVISMLSVDDGQLNYRGLPYLDSVNATKYVINLTNSELELPLHNVIHSSDFDDDIEASIAVVSKDDGYKSLSDIVSLVRYTGNISIYEYDNDRDTFNNITDRFKVITTARRERSSRGR